MGGVEAAVDELVATSVTVEYYEGEIATDAKGICAGTARTSPGSGSPRGTLGR